MSSPNKIEKNGHPFIPYVHETVSTEDLIEASTNFFTLMNRRRSIRYFSEKEIPFEVIENIVKTASTAPSGAHKQPWTFCIIKDQYLKKKIREAAEKEEYESYNNRMSEEWLKDLEPFQTDWHKEFLEKAPYLIVVFKQAYGKDDNGNKKAHYYVNESVGLACGFLIAAIHYAGLVTLTHTPNPMNFLTEILKRPSNERPFLLLPVGYPAEECYVPDIERKTFEDIAVVY